MAMASKLKLTADSVEDAICTLTIVAIAATLIVVLVYLHVLIKFVWG